MIVAIADTHAAIWHLFNDLRLSATARAFIDLAAVRSERIGLSPVSLAEIVYLVEKRRLPPNTYDAVRFAIAEPDSVFTEVAFTSETRRGHAHDPPPGRPDMPDRMIAATAVLLDVPVISRYGKIRAANLSTLW